MIADKLFESYLSFKLKVLVAAIAAAAGLLAFTPQAQAQLLTPQQVAQRQAVSPPPWPTLIQTASPNPATVGQPLTFTTTVINNSGYQGDRVSGLLPEAATLALPPALSTPNGGCRVNPPSLYAGDLASRYFVCWMSLLPAGGVANITISVIPTTPGTVTNTVQDYFGQQVQTPVTVLPMGTPNLFPPSAEGAIAAYIVQPGDTLSEIAQRYGTSVEAIAQANGIANPNLIFPGQRLSIPTG